MPPRPSFRSTVYRSVISDTLSRGGQGGHFALLREALQRLCLDLAYALARDPELSADLLERLRVFPSVATVTAPDHVLLALRQRRHCAVDRVLAQPDHDLLLDVALVLRDEIAECSLTFVADGLVEARDRACRRARLAHVLDRQLRHLRALVIRR